MFCGRVRPCPGPGKSGPPEQPVLYRGESVAKAVTWYRGLPSERRRGLSDRDAHMGRTLASFKRYIVVLAWLCAFIARLSGGFWQSSADATN